MFEKIFMCRNSGENGVYIPTSVSSINYCKEHEEKWLKMVDWKWSSGIWDSSTLTCNINSPSYGRAAKLQASCLSCVLSISWAYLKYRYRWYPAKRAYLTCLSMAGRALLAGNPRYIWHNDIPGGLVPNLLWIIVSLAVNSAQMDGVTVMPISRAKWLFLW